MTENQGLITVLLLPCVARFSEPLESAKSVFESSIGSKLSAKLHKPRPTSHIKESSCIDTTVGYVANRNYIYHIVPVSYIPGPFHGPYMAQGHH